MYFEGLSRLLRPASTCRGCAPATRPRIGAGGLPGPAGLRTDRPPLVQERRPSADRLIARKDIVDALEQGRTRLGLRLKLTHAQRERWSTMPAGDRLDAVLCLLQAGWASRGRVRPARGHRPGGRLDRQCLSSVARLEAWFAARGWEPFDFQREVWAAMAAGRSGLLHATTGSGKTYAVWLGALARAQPRRTRLQVLWLTPMRALAADTTRALQLPLPELAPRWTVGLRTGDTPQRRTRAAGPPLPSALVTTPESLSLMLTRERAARDFGGVHTVIVDEWHELHRQQARRAGAAGAGAAAALEPAAGGLGPVGHAGNLDEAMHTLRRRAPAHGRLVQGRVDKPLVIDTLLPPTRAASAGAGTWARRCSSRWSTRSSVRGTTLVFTNVRSQAEIWYQLLLHARPDWAGLVALHHGSLDKSVREWVEAGLKAGRLKAVVATSSLDLGVDFLPVERVLQIGSAKGVARLLQRAGRSGHAPGRASRVTLVPTNTLELVEAAAARRAALAGRVEARAPPDKPLDVLVQHLVTRGAGRRLRGRRAVRRGAQRAALPQAHARRVRLGAGLRRARRRQPARPTPNTTASRCVDGRWRVPDRGIARRHRLQVGTIVSDAAMQVKWLCGGTLGTHRGRLHRAAEAGRLLRLRRPRARVRAHAGHGGLRAQGDQGPAAWCRPGPAARCRCRSELADAVLALLDGCRAGRLRRDPRCRPRSRCSQAQARLSQLPTPQPAAGRALPLARGPPPVHLPLRRAQRAHRAGAAAGLAAGAARAQHLLAQRQRLRPRDPGAPSRCRRWRCCAERLFASDTLLRRRAGQPELAASWRSGAFARSRAWPAWCSAATPARRRALRQLQASSSLFFEVFRKYDAGNRLLGQAESRGAVAGAGPGAPGAPRCSAWRALPIEWVELKAPSPFSLPLMVERCASNSAPRS